MRVLLIAHSFPRDPDDMAGSFLLALARELIGRGHEVMAVAPHGPAVPITDHWDGLAVERYRYGPDARETLAYEGTMHEQVMSSWRARWRLLRLLHASRRAVRTAAARFRPDVMHVHWWFPGGLAVWPGSAQGIPWVLTSHGTDLFLLDRFPAARAVAGPIFRRATEVTVISSPLVPRAERLGVGTDRITVIPMPLTESVFGSPANAQDRDPGHVLFVGRLVERKGVEFAIRALKVLTERGRDLTFSIVGDGPEREALERLTDALDLRHRVGFVGALPPQEVARWYRRAAVLVFPTVTDWKGEQEGFGMVLVEAMRAGLPIVASRSGGIPDVIRDGDTGVLVAERDVDGLAEAIEGLIGDADRRTALAAAAQRDVQARFAPASIAERFEAVYRRAVARVRG